MSEDITSILLPAARVDFFTLDDSTAEHVRRLTEDWRFARVQVQSERMDIEGIIAKYAQVESPALIIVETNDIGETFIQKLEGLAGVCAPTTDAVIIGPENDVHLYRSLMEMGIKDYLVRPISEEDMVKVIARTLVEKHGLSASRLVTVVGSKGGVGTTAVAQALAWNISETLKQKTILFDLAGSAGSVGVSYGLEPSATLTEAARLGSEGSDDDLKRICQTATEQLTLLICGGDMMIGEPQNPDAIEALVNRLMHKFPVVVLDLSHAPKNVQKRMLSRAAEIVLVTTPLLSALRNTRAFLGELKALRKNTDGVDLVVNMQGMAAGEEVPMKDLKDSLGMDPAAVIPWQPKIFVAGESAGKPVGQNNAAAEIMGSLMPLAAKAAAVENKAPAPGKKESGSAGFLKKILGK